MELFKLFGTIAIQNADANEQIDDTTEKAKDSEGKISGAFKKIGAAVGTYFAVDKIKDFGLNCINAAADANAASSQFTQVFGDMESQASQSLANIADNTGIQVNRMKGSYTQIAAFAKTTGMDTSSALGLADRAMVAVADSAAFYDRSLEETTESLQSFLKGNYENDSALGLSCTEVTRNEAANRLYGKSFQDLAEDQKQLTLLQMVEDANAVSGALGQAARESDTWTNQTGNLKQAWEDFQAVLGANVLPKVVEIVGKAAEKVQDLSKKMPDILQKFKEWSPLIAGVVAGFVTLKGVMAISGLIGTITGAWQAYKKANEGATIAQWLFNAAMNANPIVLVISLIAGLVAALVVLWNTNDEFRANVIAAWEAVKTFIGDALVKIKETVTQAWEAIKAFVSDTVNKIKSVVIQVWTGIKDTVQTIVTTMQNTLSSIWNAILAIITSVVNGIRNTITTVWNSIKNTVQTITTTIQNVLTSIWNAISSIISSVVNGIRNTITSVWNAISSVISSVLNIIRNTQVMIWNAIYNTISGILNGIWNVMSSIWNGISGTVSSVLNGIWNVVSSVWNGISGTVSGILNGIWNTVSSIWNGISGTVSGVIDGIWNTISNGLNGAWNTVISILDGIRDKFSSIFDGVRNIVSNAIDAVKNAFNFSWSLPDLKLPHISVDGGEAPFGIGGKGSLPSFGIEWYAKAMDDGMIMDQPTIFGYNAKTNQFLAGGEAGSETVVGTQNLMDMIQAAVASKNGNDQTAALLRELLNWLTNGGLRAVIVDVLVNYVVFKINDREVARVVRRYA
nr:MAG TPA: minor tail protein [Caudoviricetes sp.]